MDPPTFRRDPWLRGSAYHLATWSLLLFVLDLRRGAADAAVADTGLAGTIVLLGATVMTSLTHERRIGKMAGPAAAPLWPGVAGLARGLAVGLVGTSAALAMAGRSDAIVTLWLSGVGAGLAAWGRRAAFGWYVGLGGATVAASLVDAGILLWRGFPSTGFRAAVLVVALPAAALWTNRTWLWFRDRGPGRPA